MDTTETLTAFINRLGLVMQCTQSGSNESRTWKRTSDEVKRDAESFHWRCEITRTTRDGRDPMVVWFTRGPAYRYRKPKAMPMDFNVHTERIEAQYPEPPFIDRLTKRAWGQPIPPPIEEVLNCLASDAESVENTTGFVEWAGEMGFDEDSYRARQIYEATTDNVRQLMRLLGGDYEHLLWNVERDHEEWLRKDGLL